MFVTKFTKDDLQMLMANKVGVAFLDSNLIYSEDLIGIEYDREFGTSDMVIKEEYILTADELIDLILEELQHHYDAEINHSNVRFTWTEDEELSGFVLKMSRNFQ